MVLWTSLNQDDDQTLHFCRWLDTADEWMPVPISWEFVEESFFDFLNYTFPEMVALNRDDFIRLQMCAFLIRGRTLLEAARGYRVEPERGEELWQYRGGSRCRRRPLRRFDRMD